MSHLPIPTPGDPAPPSGVKHVLILMSETGGGHRAAAEAIRDGFNHQYENMASVSIVDAWKDHVAWPVNRTANTYGWLVNDALWLWKSIWFLEHVPRLVDNLLKLAYPMVEPGLYRLFQDYAPDVIVSVHPLMTQFPLRVLKRRKLRLPFVTVVTDLVGGHHTWYQPETTLCLVPTDKAREKALKYGVPAGKIEVVGQPVALKFAEGVGEKSDMRRRLGLQLDLPVVLLVGGGEGYGRLFDIARCIAQKRPRAQLLVVAGRNETMRKRLEGATWEIPTRIYGFVNNMPDLMGATDIFITKAGPGSICEAFIAGLPLIIFGYIPGQEEGNLRYVKENDAGVYLPDPQAIADLVYDWLKPDNPILTGMAQNAAGLARPEAALTIARRIYELVD